MELIKSVNLALRFLLELCAVAALAYWGFQSGSGLIMKIILGVGVPLLTVVIWAIFVASNAAVHLPEPIPFVLGLIILGLAAAALAVVFGVIVVINAVLMVIWGQ
ncbi:MAG: YrdB family protein [Chloroflexota bacterium]|nr:YrdB family protein [Chloroflexota bacterium]